MKKIIIIILLLSVIGYFSYKYFDSKKEKKVILYGNVEINQVNLAFQASGQLQTLNFEEGDFIKEGELLASLDKKPYEIKLRQAKAQLAQSKVSLENINAFYKRNIPLCNDNVISKQECDDIKTRKKTIESNIQYYQSIIDEAQLNLSYTDLFSPSNGIIISRILEKGSIVNSGMPVYILSLNDKMWVRSFIEEPYLGIIQIGQKVVIKNDSGKEYIGTVGFISPVAEFTPKNIETPSLRTSLVYRTKIIIDKPDNYLKQGMPVTIELE